jgi:hypothetical protein
VGCLVLVFTSIVDTESPLGWGCACEPGSPVQSWEWSLRPSAPDAGHFDTTETAISVGADERVGPEPLEVLENGEQWGTRATELQWRDATAVLAREPSARRFWIGRTRGYSKTGDAAGHVVAGCSVDWSLRAGRASSAPPTVIRRAWQRRRSMSGCTAPRDSAGSWSSSARSGPVPTPPRRHRDHELRRSERVGSARPSLGY